MTEYEELNKLIIETYQNYKSLFILDKEHFRMTSGVLTSSDGNTVYIGNNEDSTPDVTEAMHNLMLSTENWDDLAMGAFTLQILFSQYNNYFDKIKD